MIDTLQANHG